MKKENKTKKKKKKRNEELEVLEVCMKRANENCQSKTKISHFKYNKTGQIFFVITEMQLKLMGVIVEKNDKRKRKKV